ncbi:MAG: hypothetical protein WAV41_01900 [Microgenomates group bacterium]
MDARKQEIRDKQLYHLKEGEKVLMVTRRGAQGARPSGIDTGNTGFQILETLPELGEDGILKGENNIVVIGRVRF